MDDKERIRVLEARAEVLSAQVQALNTLVQALLHHFDENEHTARFIERVMEGCAVGALADGTMTEGTRVLIEPLTLALLPSALLANVQRIQNGQA